MPDDSPRVFDGPPQEAERDLVEFLEWLGRPALFRLQGRDSSRARLVSGGLHGNEPSGFYAIHALLRDPPADLPTDALLMIGNVEAALRDPVFSNRAVPGGPDMNRVWGEFHRDTPLAATARGLLEEIGRYDLEAFADLHNNTGYNPVYGVVTRPEVRDLGVARAWTSTFILYGGLHLGSLMEQVCGRAPGAVIECGQAGQPKSDAIALEGARRFLLAEDAAAGGVDFSPDDVIYRSVARITVPQDVELAFTSRESARADLILSEGIDRYNFVELEAGHTLALCSAKGRLVVEDNRGEDVTDAFLERADGQIRTRRPIVPVMMTNNAKVAKADCLFYVAEATTRSGFGAIAGA